jgi:hypothetical protein
VNDPIDYDEALRDLLRKRRQRRITSVLRRLPDPRPTSPGQVMLLGVALVVVGWLLPALHALVMAGLVILVFGFVTGMFQPRVRRVTWRNREIDLPPEDHWTHHVYHIIYRRPL